MIPNPRIVTEKRKIEDSDSVESKKAREDEEEILKRFQANFDSFLEDLEFKRDLLEILERKEKRDEDARRALSSSQPIGQGAQSHQGQAPRAPGAPILQTGAQQLQVQLQDLLNPQVAAQMVQGAQVQTPGTPHQILQHGAEPQAPQMKIQGAQPQDLLNPMVQGAHGAQPIAPHQGQAQGAPILQPGAQQLQAQLQDLLNPQLAAQMVQGAQVQAPQAQGAQPVPIDQLLHLLHQQQQLGQVNQDVINGQAAPSPQAPQAPVPMIQPAPPPITFRRIVATAIYLSRHGYLSIDLIHLFMRRCFPDWTSANVDPENWRSDVQRMLDTMRDVFSFDSRINNHSLLYKFKDGVTFAKCLDDDYNAMTHYLNIAAKHISYKKD